MQFHLVISFTKILQDVCILCTIWHRIVAQIAARVLSARQVLPHCVLLTWLVTPAKLWARFLHTPLWEKFEFYTLCTQAVIEVSLRSGNEQELHCSLLFLILRNQAVYYDQLPSKNAACLHSCLHWHRVLEWTQPNATTWLVLNWAPLGVKQIVLHSLKGYSLYLMSFLFDLGS